jgi:hypothetical protein
MIRLSKISLLFVLLVASAVLSVSPAGAYSIFDLLGGQRVGTASAQFLKIGVGARATGMGEAFVAVADDVSTLYWNPAGIAMLNRHAVLASHADWPVDMSHEFVGAVWNLRGSSAIGIQATVLSSDDILRTSEYKPAGTGTYFSIGSFAAGVTYAQGLTDRFVLGGTIKYVQEDMDNLTSKAIMADMGTLYYVGYRSLRIGMSVVNFGGDMRPGGTYQAEENGEDVEKEYEAFSPPTEGKFGVAMDAVNSESHILTLSMEIDHAADEAEKAKVGFEWAYGGMASLRGGYVLNVEERGLSLGAGAAVGGDRLNASVDYSYSDFGRLGAVHRVSIDVGF